MYSNYFRTAELTIDNSIVVNCFILNTTRGGESFQPIIVTVRAAERTRGARGKILFGPLDVIIFKQQD